VLVAIDLLESDPMRTSGSGSTWDLRLPNGSSSFQSKRSLSYTVRPPATQWHRTPAAGWPASANRWTRLSDHPARTSLRGPNSDLWLHREPTGFDKNRRPHDRLRGGNGVL